MLRFYQSYQIQQTVSVKLSWSHYCELLTISDPDKRSFYEKEAINSGWSIRGLKWQISTSLYERLLLSEGKANKETVLALAEKGIEVGILKIQPLHNLIPYLRPYKDHQCKNRNNIDHHADDPHKRCHSVDRDQDNTRQKSDQDIA